MQTKEQLEEFYEQPDPWGYKTNPEDIRRKNILLGVARIYAGRFDRALDIGCGEGWITQDLPALEINGIEISDLAAKRIPKNVTRVTEPYGKYDLVVATGVIYEEYDVDTILKWVKESCIGLFITVNIDGKELTDKLHCLGRPKIFEAFYPYREFTHWLKIYDFRSYPVYRAPSS